MWRILRDAGLEDEGFSDKGLVYKKAPEDSWIEKADILCSGGAYTRAWTMYELPDDQDVQGARFRITAEIVSNRHMKN